MKKRFSGPQIVAKLRQADIQIGQGKNVPEVCKEIEISQQTYYRWRQKYGGMSPDMIKQLKVLQKENAQLKRLVADQALDISILKVAAEGNFQSRPDEDKLQNRFVESWDYQNARFVKYQSNPEARKGISQSCRIRTSP